MKNPGNLRNEDDRRQEKLMRNFVSFYFMALALGFAATAQAESVTGAQIVEVYQLFDHDSLDTLLDKRRSEASYLQPKGCTEIVINYDLTPAEVASWFQWSPRPIKDGSFKANPHGKDRVTKEACWFKFYLSVPSEEAQKQIEASGEFLVADLWELNAFGIKRSDLANRFPIIGFGSQWRDSDDNINVPVLVGNGGGQQLSLSWYGPGLRWYSRGLFLAIRK